MNLKNIGTLGSAGFVALIAAFVLQGCAASEPLESQGRTPLMEILGQIQHLTVQSGRDISSAKKYVDQELKNQKNITLPDARLISYSTATPNHIFFEIEPSPCLSDRALASSLDLYGFRQTRFHGQPDSHGVISQSSDYVKDGPSGSIWIYLSPRHSQDKHCITDINFSAI